jgi:hypothetical protein
VKGQLLNPITFLEWGVRKHCSQIEIIDASYLRASVRGSGCPRLSLGCRIQKTYFY